jgi:hypothetical protein
MAGFGDAQNQNLRLFVNYDPAQNVTLFELTDLTQLSALAAVDSGPERAVVPSTLHSRAATVAGVVALWLIFLALVGVIVVVAIRARAQPRAM